MTSLTRLDLNAVLENWRKELAAQPQLTPEDRRELEKHLTDSMVELRQRGLSEEESFWLARRRMGDLRQVAEEFVKTNPGEVWRDRIFWILLGGFLLGQWSWLTSSVAMKFYSGKADVPWLDSLVQAAGSIFPLIIAIMLVKGKLMRLPAAISWAIANKARFVKIAISLSIVTSAFDAFAMTQSPTQPFMQNHISNQSAFVLGWMMFFFINVVSIAIIIYFMPKEYRRPPAVEAGRLDDTLISD
jgi:hypothetical protein